MPFINSTTGAVETALSIAAFVSVDSRREWRVEGSWKAAVRGCTKLAGRESGRNTLGRLQCLIESKSPKNPKYTYRRECCPRKHGLKASDQWLFRIINQNCNSKRVGIIDVQNASTPLRICTAD